MAPARRAQGRRRRARRLGGLARALVQRRRAAPRHRRLAGRGAAGGDRERGAALRAVRGHAAARARLQHRRALPHARLPPGQPLLHRPAGRGEGGGHRSRAEVIRLAIEEALLASHRHVFGVLLWYLILPGPSGAILYRLAAYFAWRWRDLGAFGGFATRAFYYLEWPALRLTAAAFAIVG